AARRTPPRATPNRPLSPAELRDYLDHLNERDPNQLMGAVTEGSLWPGVITATVGTAVLMLACTLVPYFWSHYVGHAQVTAPQAPAAAAPQAPAQSEAAPDAAPATAAAAKPAAEPAKEKPAISKKVMGGVDEVKQSDPNVNPLDKIDDLFDKTR